MSKKLILMFTFVFATFNLKAQTTLKAYAGADRELCYGSSTTLGATSVATGGLSPYSYNWSPAIAISSSSVAHPVVNPLVSTTYVLKVTDANSNSANDTIVVKVFDITLYAHAGTDITKCQFTELIGGDSLSATGGDAPYEYLWTNNSGDTVAAIARPSLFVDTSRTFYLRVIDNKGCISNDSFHLIVNTPIHAYGLSDTTIYLGERVVLQDTIVGGTGTISYAWSPNRWLDDTTAENPLCTPLSSQQYKLVVTDGKGCTDVTFATITYEPINFGQLSSFAAFAVDSITAGDSSYFIGNIGATYIDTTYMHIYGERHMDGEEIENLSSGLDDLIASVNEMQGETISSELENETIQSGVYFISGDASFNQNLTLQGNDSSLFIFNISGDLIIGDTAHLILDGVANDKVIFNVGGSLRLGENPELYGSYLIGERVVGGGFNGEANLLCKMSLEYNGRTDSHQARSTEIPYDCSSSPVLPANGYLGFRTYHGSTYSLIYNDEFNTSALDITPVYGYTIPHQFVWWEWAGGWYPNCYFDHLGQNINGDYYINAQHQLVLKLHQLGPNTNYYLYTTGGNTYNFSGANIISKISFYKGYFEIRAKVPHAIGTWPAFWMVGGGCESYREIDWFDWMIERKQMPYGVVNKNENCEVIDNSGGFVCPLDANSKNINMSDGYHIYAGKWEDNTITFYVDGIDVGSVINGLHNNARMQLAFQNIATWPHQNPNNGQNNETGKHNNGEDDYIVDYVRVWQKNSDLLNLYLVCDCNQTNVNSLTVPVESSQTHNFHVEAEELGILGWGYHWSTTSSNIIIDPNNSEWQPNCYFYANAPGNASITLNAVSPSGQHIDRTINFTVANNTFSLSTPSLSYSQPIGNQCLYYYHLNTVPYATSYQINIGGTGWQNVPTNFSGYFQCPTNTGWWTGNPTSTFSTFQVRALCNGTVASNVGGFLNLPASDCSNWSQRLLDTLSNNQSIYITVYPSPSDGDIWVQNYDDNKISVSLFSLSGIKIAEVFIDGKSNQKLSDLPEGTYILSAQSLSDNHIVYRKLISIIK